jgi:hypothetical protein
LKSGTAHQNVKNNQKRFIHFIVTQGMVANTVISEDAGLEAFSHNPTDCSFTALPLQATVFTKYLNELFLSY